MLKDITFGQYYKKDSVIHKTDPRVKIVLLIAAIVFIFLAHNFVSLLYMTCCAAALLLASKVPFRMYVKNIKAILPILIFTGIINLFYGMGGTQLVSFWHFHITTGGVYRAVFMAMRIVLLIFVSAVLTYTTTPNDLTDAIESLLSPLRFVGLKNAVHTLAMMMTIALRFIPTLIEETEKIMNAQKARGADLESGNLIEKVRALIPILIPLLISAVRRAYELAEAMECRCYNGGGERTRMKQMRMKAADYAAFGITAVLGSAVILLNLFFTI